MDPWAVAAQMFSDDQLPMLGCEHALIAAGALLTSLRNSNQVAVTNAMLQEATQRTKRQALGGYCGLTGVCGVAVGVGAVFSVILEAACPKDKETRQTMQVVGQVVQRIAEMTGPCCCKAFVLGALDVARAACLEIWGIALPQGQVPVCQQASRHPHGCRGHICPYHKCSL